MCSDAGLGTRSRSGKIHEDEDEVKLPDGIFLRVPKKREESLSVLEEPMRTLP